MPDFSKFSLVSKITVIGSLAMIVILGVTLILNSGPQQTGEIASRTTGQALIGGPFELVDQTGEPFTEADLEGRYSLIFFGYTYCPDACPVALPLMKNAINRLPPAQAEQVQPVFITVDPERDTVQQVARYIDLDAYPDNLVGLTGTPEQVANAMAAYRIAAQKVVDDGSAADYLMNHTTLVFLMGKEGEFLTAMSHLESPERVSQQLARYIASQ